ncbi:xylosidase : arab-like proteininofuranosidase [Decorospora gaudefroyi]|uniref:Xylosidase: arab-like proteininofuranosidase n=1 Tax=Decorospora gaudefroyi TaxID=184978 RepID=A0A6A5K8V9_9PLEO|nr:xylosidase : arab-like proteininofuranosidase [Decorospora gaudefroyi]
MRSFTIAWVGVTSVLCGWGNAQLFNSRWFNPILPGFHPDPSCIFHKPDETFYCASSSFNVFPGIPIHASKDLTNWRLIGHALNRKSQLPVLAESVGSTSGIWAPALRFHNGTFYLLTTMVHDKRADNDSSRWDNVIFSTRNLWDESKWTDAVHLDFEGYDISPHWDDQGNSYIVGSHAWKIAYGIHLNKVNLETGELLGDWTNLWNGTGGIAPEGPHIFKKDGWYYLMIAEGGTGLLHMETIARSKNLYGPYEANPANPILTNANTTEYFQAVGHADLFQDARGQWWGVALAVRSGPEWETFPMGRETVLYNATWEEGAWPRLENPIEGEMRGWSLPAIIQHLPGDGPWVDQGDNSLRFQPNTSIPPHFVYWRPPIPENYAVSPPGHANTLRLTPSNLNLTALDGNSPGPGGQTFISRRQVDTLFNFTFDLDFAPTIRGEEAGITLFLSQNHHARMGVAMLPLRNSTKIAPHFHFHAESYIPVPADVVVPVPTSWLNTPLTLSLRTVNVTHYVFGAGPADGSAPVKNLAYVGGDIISWGFTGALLGAYATTNGGGNGGAEAFVTNWRYRGWGQVRENWNGTGI